MTQDQTPQFNLPQRPAGKARGSAAGTLACVLLIVVVGLQIYGLTRSGEAERIATVEPVGRIPSDDLQAAAMKLEDRNLALAGADVWYQYMTNTALEPLDQAKVLYRIAKLQFQSAQYEYAVANLYLAERLAGDRDDQLSHQIAMLVRESLQSMGRYSELSREMAARAAPESDTDSTLGGRQVVAQIGDEKITVADFERMLQAELDASLDAQAGISPEQADEFRRQTARQFADPQAKTQLLQQMVAGRVLAAEARQTRLDQSVDYRRRLLAFADHQLASMLMSAEIGRRAVVTPEDTQRFYKAEKDRYAEPAKITLAHILCASEDQAKEVLAKAQANEDFTELATQFSTDERTKSDGGRIAQSVTKDAPTIPGIGHHPDLQSALWAVAPGSVLNEVYQSGAGWHVVKVLDRTERVEKSYDQVKDRVERDARAARQQEVTQQYLRELFDRHEVKLYPEAFLMTPGKTGAAKDQ